MSFSNTLDIFRPSEPHDLSSISLYVMTLAIAYLVTNAFYNLYLHPLRHVPGPRLYAASGIPHALDLLRGKTVEAVTRLHNQYGDVVRIGPGELSFISAESAWKDIYGFRGSKALEMHKDPIWYSELPNGVPSLIIANREIHSRQRRAFSHAFSDRALREQEQLIQKYIGLLMERLSARAETGRAVDLVQYYNYTTFDIIGDLVFNEPFGCLEKDDYHEYVRGVFASLRGLTFKTALNYYHAIRWLLFRLHPNGPQAGTDAFFHFSAGRVEKRLATKTSRPDMITYVTEQLGSKMLSEEELKSNAFLLLVAGSETTATVLSGTTFLLLKHPQVMEKLVHEIRSRFKNSDEITYESVNRLPYLVAVLNEGMRLYPPVPTGFPRVVHEGGATISGHYVPENTSVYVSQWPAYHSERNFTEPESFIPQRWLGDEPRFEKDNAAAFQPFSYGPRACLGKNLAYLESRVILAQVLFNFDIDLIDKEMDWLNQRCFTLWEKPELTVQLKKAVIE